MKLLKENMSTRKHRDIRGRLYLCATVHRSSQRETNLLSLIINNNLSIFTYDALPRPSFCVCFQWQSISLTVIEKVQIAAIILGSLFLIASISWLVWSSLSPSAKWQRQDLLFQICYGMYGFMDIVCIGKTSCTVLLILLLPRYVISPVIEI